MPSEIVYDDLNKVEDDPDGWSFVFADSFDTKSLQKALGKNAKAVRYGFEISQDEERFRCMKLFLDPAQELPSYVPRSEIRAQLAKSEKEATEVVADYLREIYKHTQFELIKRYGELFLETTSIQWILTVPAVWSDAAKDATLTAAKQAGMGPDLKLISEPEAAAVYTLQAVQPQGLLPNDNFVVCDAGGGTVDLISYEIKQLRPLRIEESAEGTGACCGAAMLNIKFEELIRAKMGDEDFQQLCREQSRAWLEAWKYFEEFVKRNYNPLKPKSYNVPLPGVADNDDAGIFQGYLTISADEVKSIFNPIIMQVIGLVENQMTHLRSKGKTVTGVILVGGFGQSRCLYEALRLRFTGKHSASAQKLETGHVEHNPRFEVQQAANAWTAVVRGAVLRGLEGEEIVISRQSRRHYGISTRKPFDPSVHPDSCAVYDDLKEQWMATDRMKWFIRYVYSCVELSKMPMPNVQPYYFSECPFDLELGMSANIPLLAEKDKQSLRQSRLGSRSTMTSNSADAR